MRRPFALFVLGSAALASVATSPLGWDVESVGQGSEIALDATNPSAELGVEVINEIDEALLADTYGQLTLEITVLDLVPVDEEPVTLDFVLYEDTDRGDREITAVRGWTLVPATEEVPNPEVVSLSHDDFRGLGTVHAEVTLVSGSAAVFQWAAYGSLSYSGRADYPGDDAFRLNVTPAAGE